MIRLRPRFRPWLALPVGALAGLLVACASSLPGEETLRVEPTERLPPLVERLEAHVADDPEDDEGLRLLSLAERRLGRNEAAVAHALRAVRAAPFAARNHLALGEAHEASGKLIRALAAYAQAIQLDPSLLPPYLRHAQVQVRLGEREAALETLAEVIRREPRHYGARWLQARLLLELERPGEAVEAIEAARRLRPADPEARALHVRILAALGRSEAALRLAEQGLEAEPGQRDLLQALLRLHRERGEWDAARRALERLERAGPLTPPERLLRVEVLAGQGLEAEARTALEALLRAAPDYAPAHTRQAEHLVREGRPREALREAQQAIALDPQFAEAHYWEAVAHFLLEDPALGDAALEAARRLEPDALAVRLLRIVRLLGEHRLDAAAPLLDPLLAGDRAAQPPVLLVHSLRVTLQGDRELAAQVLDRIPPTFDPPQVRYGRLRLAYLDRRWDEVATLSEPLLAHPLLGWRATYLRAAALLRQGNAPQVLATVRPYLEGPQRRLIFHHLAGYAYLLQGDRVAAQRTFLSGIALAPGHPLMIEGLSRMAMDAEDWPRAQELLRQGMEAPGDFRRLFLDRLIQIAQRRKDVQLSREALDRYLDSMDPARAGGLPQPASGVLVGAFVPDFELRPAP